MDISSIYPNGFSIPTGFKCKKIDKPAKGDLYIPVTGSGIEVATHDWTSFSRVIVEKDTTATILFMKKVRFLYEDSDECEVYLVTHDGFYFDRLTKCLSKKCTNGWSLLENAEVLVREAEKAGFVVDKSSL